MDDDTLLIRIAIALWMSTAEVAKRRDAEPTWFADVVAKYGLGGGKGDEVAGVKG